MSGLDQTAEWAQDHKAVAAGAVGATLLAILYLRHRSRAAASTTGATTPDLSGASLVPYGDATTSGIAGLTDAITGLTTTLTPPNDTGNANVGGTGSGAVTPTPGAAGTGAATGTVSKPKTPVPIVVLPGGKVGHAAPPPVHKAYVVKPGDTLSRIAVANHLTLGQIEALNPQTKSNPNLIHPGDRLLVS